MAKQKVKQTLGAGAGSPDDPEGAAGRSDPARARMQDRPTGKAGVLKRAGKRKAKAPGKGKGEAASTAVAATPLLQRVHKIARRPFRLGPIERLGIAVDEVRKGGRASPRTRKLQTSGLPKMAQKVIEEAGEVAIEAIQGNRAALVSETVDLLYHLVVLLTEAGIPLQAIWDEMDRREIVLGMAEKLPKAPEPDA